MQAADQPTTAVLQNYVLHLADTNLVLGQRLGAWCGHGPVLEQDIALTNIALDLVGQARQYYSFAAELRGDGTTEDDLAYLRGEREFTNLLLVEQENGDWGRTLVRQFLYDAYQFELLTKLRESSNEHLAAVAVKSLKEVAYHRRWSSGWLVRLGDGTQESHRRVQTALTDLWRYTGELTSSSAPLDEQVAELKLGPRPEALSQAYHSYVHEVLQRATLKAPELPAMAMRTGGKQGLHSEKLGYLLAEMQSLHRAHPGATW